jgi:hypothetical protein
MKMPSKTACKQYKKDFHRPGTPIASSYVSLMAKRDMNACKFVANLPNLLERQRMYQLAWDSASDDDKFMFAERFMNA